MKINVILSLILVTVVATVASFYVERQLKKRYAEVTRPS